MLRGYYTAANGIINEQRILNVITNNLANAKTAGYKADEAIPTTFAEELLLINGRHSNTGTIRYRTIDYTYTNTEQGSFENTGSRLDMLLVGNIYFNIEERRTGETLLTRNGQFTINSEGYLTLGTTGYVLDENGERMQLGTADFQVDRFGELTTDDGRVFQLGLSYVAPESDVEKVDDNLMRPYEDAPIGNLPEDLIYRVEQGWFERSNVDLAEETIAAMDAQHVFTACSSALKIVNSMNQLAVNELASIS
ncbi:MAG: flagellar hook-basal body complex protein [Oscillospiraceae bacterium]|nr:flagellar hook-basal body complex protein [Oscillospiraceae bacterium]MDE7279578.1 flagellar hook-basal body complex protein [Oscillospiraceae bacterium]